MAKATLELIDALRQTASRLRGGTHYAWGHHGACNCGNLLQVLTPFTEDEIRSLAQTAKGEWTELAEAYCPTTNAPVNFVLGKLLAAGLTPVDIRDLERLSNREVLKRLPGGFRWLKKNNREDVILYFDAFAALLEEQWLDSIELPEFDDCADPINDTTFLPVLVG